MIAKLFGLALPLLLSSYAHAGFPASQAPARASVQLQNADVADTPLDVVQDGGFGMVRKGVYWKTVESVKGKYDFTSSDSIVAKAKARGLHVSMTLYGNNSLYETASSPGIITDAGRKGFAAFAAALAGRYKGSNIVYEIWNEPNLKSFWGTQSNSNSIAAEYTALVKVVAPAMLKADPAATIVAGSISTLWDGSPGSFQWFDECVKQGLLSTGISGISQHPYGSSYPELMLSLYTKLRSKMDAGGGKSLVLTNTEVGYDLEWIVERQKFTEAQASDVQGWMFVRQQLIDQIFGMKYSNWYQFRDSDPKWPVVTKTYEPLSVYKAAQVYAAQLSGYTFKERVSQSDSNNFVVIFENSSGRQKAVVWTAKPTSTASIKVSANVTGSVTSADTYGTSKSLTVSSGAVTVAATNNPVYVDLGSKATNLALNIVPTVSSNSSSAKYLTDGNTSSTTSRWMSSSSYPQSVTVSFSSAKTVSQVNYLQYAQRTSAYKVEIYANSKWTTVATSSSNSATTINAKFSAVKASKVRFTVTAGTLYQKVFEMQVLGY